MISGSKFILRALLLLPVTAWAQDDSASLAAVMNNLASVRFASGHFVEEKYLSTLTEPLESQGILTYTAPDHVEKITTIPDPQSLIVRGNQLEIEQGGETHTLSLSDHPEIQTFVESIRSTLGGNLPALQDYYTVGFKGTPDTWELRLQPTDTTVQQIVTSIDITGIGDRLTHIETLAANGDRSDMTITPNTP